MSFVGPLVAGRVTGMPADGTVVSAPVDDLDRRDLVMRPSFGRGLVADRLGGLVTATIFDGQPTIVACKAGGSDARPIVLGPPRAPKNCGPSRMVATPRGDIALYYLRLRMGSIPPCGVDVLAADGSGFIAFTLEVPAFVASIDPDATESRTLAP